MLKKLTVFLLFVWDKFAVGKEFTVVGVSPWLDYDTKQTLGTKVDVFISADRTPYPVKNGETVSNLYEKLSFKVSKTVTIPVGSKVIPVNPVATVYGEYRNQLSVKCDDIKILQPKGVA